MSNVFMFRQTVAQSDDKQDGRAWALRILKRQQNGEKLPAISVEFAREALGMEPQRQPGEDD